MDSKDLVLDPNEYTEPGTSVQAVAASPDGTLVAVGCRDGRVLMFVATETEITRSSTADSDATFQPPVSSLCHLINHRGRAHWLVGRVGGRVDLLSCTEDGSDLERRDLLQWEADPYQYPTAVAYLRGHADSLEILVSYAHHFGGEVDANCASRLVEVTNLRDPKPFKPLEARATRQVFPVWVGPSDSGWLLYSHTGEVSLLRWSKPDGYREELIENPWDPSQGDAGVPTLVFDAVRLSAATDRETRILVSTDAGLFQSIYGLLPNGGTPALRNEPFRRPFTHGIGLAVAALTIADPESWLWSSDSLGASRLDRIKRSDNGNREEWPSVHHHRQASPAVQAVATPGPGGVGLRIWQGRRDESFAVSTFLPGDCIASLASIDEARSWLEANYEPRADTKSSPPDEAILADLLDPPYAKRDHLWRFLANPSTHLFIEVLKRLPVQEVAAVLEMWVHAVVGSVNRLQPPHPEDRALEVIRWLRLLKEDGCRGDDLQDGSKQILRQEVSRLQFAIRRWCIFAPPNDAPLRGIHAQLERLKQPVPGVDPKALEEELLVKSAALFDRRVDEEGLVHHDSDGGVAFSAVKLLLDGRTLFAILWRHKEIRFYERVSEQGACSLRALPRAASAGALLPSASASARKRFGRALIAVNPAPLGRDNAPFLLTSVRVEEDGRDPVEHLVVARVKRDEAGVRLEPPEKTLQIDHQGTVYALADIGGSSFLAGLRTKRNETRVLRGSYDRSIGFKHQSARQWSLLPEPKNASHPVPNAVTALAVVRDYEARGDQAETVIAGCSGGQVLELDLGGLERRKEDGEGGVREVGRLSVPIWSVAARRKGEVSRVFAGTADGSIFAWEDLRGYEEADENRPGDFAVLWATRDSGPIVCIDTACVNLGPSRETSHIVLAVARNGRAILFDDSDRIGPGSAGRPRIPGQRLERFKLGSSAFVGISADDETRGLPIRLLIVDRDSTVRLLALYYPKRSPVRKDSYKGLWEQWKRFVGKHSDRKQPDPRRQRMAEALRLLAPDLWLLPIPFLLRSVSQPREGDSNASDPLEWDRRFLDIERYWFPRYLRPFVDAAEAYRKINELFTAEGATSPGAVKHHLPALTQGLAESLHAAFELGDRLLFKEIVENALKHFNTLIKNVCLRGDALLDRDLQKAYSQLLQTLEVACRSWLSTSPSDYERVQINRVKNLVDGDVLVHLAQAKRGGERTALDEIIGERTEHVRRLLMDTEPLVPIEALRAVNLSLLRASWLSDDRNSPNIDDFQAVLGAFSSQSGASSDDVLKYEIARAYATCLYVSPNRAARLAMGTHEARLDSKIADQVQLQARLVNRLLSDRPKTPLTRRQPELIDFLRDPVGGQTSPRGSFWPDPTAAKEVAERFESLRREFRDFETISDSFRPVDDVVNWLLKLAGLLRADPDRVSFSELRGLVEALKSSSDGADRLFLADIAFWIERLNDLARILTHHGIGETPLALNTVSPSIVAGSMDLSDWARVAIETAGSHEERRKLHEPFLGIYRNALSRFRDAAKELRRSAAVQRRLVTGVLSHHLLEALDHHVLDLRQIAHVAQPLDLFPGQELRMPGTTERFAKLRGSQAARATVIPKNLRTLHQLLASTESRTAEEDLYQIALESFLENASEIEIDPNSARGPHPKLASEEAMHLRLVLDEIASNHRIHGAPVPPRARRTTGGIEFRCGFDGSEEKRKRLEDARDGKGELLMPRALYVDESSGLGLYLATLSAAMVGWRLWISDVAEREVTFVLEKVGTTT